MSVGLYIHIPFCLQRCYYCDFATYTQSEMSISIQEYVNVLITEINKAAPHVLNKKLKTIYFGGGTPSLLEPEQFELILSALRANQFEWDEGAEVTIEINPATLDSAKIRSLIDLGVNRFSVGAQTFNDRILKRLNRKHSARDTYDTLDLLHKLNCNYSFDLLFALPEQTLGELLIDLKEIEFYRPPHISPYYLTIPTNHILSPGRPHEDEEIEMFQLIRSFLAELNYEQYEISNFARSKELRSKHNSIYWNDSPYLGIGLSSHSYFNEQGLFGTRFSNPRNINDYFKWVEAWNPQSSLLDGRISDLVEVLKGSESLTDFCHISLRKAEGLSRESLQTKFGSGALKSVEQRLQSDTEGGLVSCFEGVWTLTDRGKDLSNQVFLNLTFLDQDYPLAP